MLDFTSPFGKHALKRLAEEEILWLTTTDSQGAPQPRPVWFYWDGETVLVFSQPSGYKLNHIQRNPQVALNFNSTQTGGDVVVLTGEAEVVPAPVPGEQLEAYINKYRQGIARINLTPQEFQNSYSVPIRVRLLQLRGH